MKPAWRRWYRDGRMEQEVYERERDERNYEVYAAKISYLGLVDWAEKQNYTAMIVPAMRTLVWPNPGHFVPVRTREVP